MIDKSVIEISRFITKVENQDVRALEILEERLKQKDSKTRVIGITGSPGAGKSTLTNCLIRMLSKKSKVAVIAIDPASLFSDGALLGDRVRMQEHSTNPNVFIRSVSNRNCLGGLSAATPDIIRVFMAYDYDYVIVETVGVGQDEIDIVKFSDTVMLVLHPASGDDMQAMKAGVMEIADLFVVNKCDLKNEAEKTFNIIEYWVRMNPRQWDPPIVKTSAIDGEGIEKLIENLETHHEFIKENPDVNFRRNQLRAKHEITRKMQLLIEKKISQINPKEYDIMLDKVINNQTRPLEAANHLLKGVLL